MNRPENSLSLDSVICRRCNAVSGAGESTCPFCGADREGAIFTARADTPAHAANDDYATTPNQLDVRRSNWLTRRVRRKMLTSYPGMAEPDNSAPASPRRPARSGIAVLVGMMFAVLAAGVYLYVDSDDDDPTAGRLAVSAAGAVRDGPASADTPETNAVTARPSIDEKRLGSEAAVAAGPATEPAPLVRRDGRASQTPRVVAASGPVIAAIASPGVSVAGIVPSIAPAAPVVSVAPANKNAATSAAKPSTARGIDSATQTAAPLDKPNASTTQAAAGKEKPGMRNIASLQQALASHDLASARRQMRGLSASERRSPEIERFAADLSRQERERDRAIATSHACAASRDPACAVRNARRAVALDPKNAQAQASLRHALAVQAQSNAEYFRQAGAIPKPVVPAMTFDGRWSAAPKHAGSSSAQNDAARGTFFGWGVPTTSKGRGDAH
ncbi:hypothetical protein AWB79_01696 [Caballeronia hypogeia]|uniref:Uncharacterized protein n=1 Tax=Caballeronia hypogeia TaxID=1777140 RepID=A0A157ZZI8_9BURK|nr:hypothetical protein [Caballeronia hypogeia]SAK50913.1 hypothetical protein AWB79_01696 [Caballeronia hypogeia]